MCVFCTFLNGSLQLGALSVFIHLVFLEKQSCISKCEIPIILKLFPNISVVLEQIHIFKMSVIAELAVSDLL